MPSQRRVRLYALLFALTVLVLFYMSRGAPLTHASDFTTKTQDALQSQEYAEAARQRDADSVGSRLKAAEAAAKKAADDKSTDFKVAVQGDADKSVAGRVKLGAHDDKKVPGVAAHGGRPHDSPIAEGETDEEHNVEIELNAILKKSPSTFHFSFASLLSQSAVLVAFIVPKLTQPQPSSSPNPTAPSPNAPNTSSSRNTP